ncbi:MAG: hypothetical protein KA354_14775 [Phycisphaerae bacterium]|nr:hypothetical protein [Phycisphaerae bacterium]
MTAITGTDGLTIDVLAGQDSTGRPALLIADVHATSTTCDIQLADGSKATDARLTIQLVSDAARVSRQ